MTRFYIGLRDPLGVRRETLESTREVIASLQNYERFVQVRNERLSLMNELRRTVYEVSLLTTKVISELPRTRGSTVRSTERTAKDEKKVTVSKYTRVSELEKLERMLSSIEDDLRKLA